MGAQYKTLIEIKVVTDHDCGNYKIGELNYSIGQNFYDYFKEHDSGELLKLFNYLGQKALQTRNTSLYSEGMIIKSKCDTQK